MSHEIRTPMTAILGYADLLLDPTLNPGELSPYAATIRRSGEHLLALINDILDLSKIEAGKMSLDMQRCDVVAMLADVASMIRPRGEQRGIALSVEYHGPIPETILTDSACLASGHCQPGRQCRQVHRPRPRADRDVVAAPMARRATGHHVRGDRHRDRHPRGSSSATLPTVQPG